jgi:hypothetical protein
VDKEGALMGNELECLPRMALAVRSKMALAIFEERFSLIRSALATGKELREKYKFPSLLHEGLDQPQSLSVQRAQGAQRYAS